MTAPSMYTELYTEWKGKPCTKGLNKLDMETKKKKGHGDSAYREKKNAFKTQLNIYRMIDHMKTDYNNYIYIRWWQGQKASKPHK